MADRIEPSHDLLAGAAAIADYLGMTERRVRYLAEKELLPVFWMGKRMMARKSTLEAHFERLEKGGELHDAHV
jgi:hypothetical protein